MLFLTIYNLRNNFAYFILTDTVNRHAILPNYSDHHF